MENKRFITVLIFIVLLIVVIPIINYFGSKESNEIMQKFNDALAAQEYTFVEFGQENCSFCKQQKVVLDGLVENYGLEYMYIDIRTVKSSHLTKMLKTLGIESSKFGTPTMAIIGNNKVEELIEGLIDEVALAEKLEPYEVMDEYGFTEFEKIDYDKYYSLIKSKKEVVIVLEKTGCSACEAAKPHLKRASYVTGTKIYSLTIDEVFASGNETATDEENAIAKKFLASLPIYKDGVGTPTVLIVKKSKVVDAYTNGAAEASVYIDFLKKNNLAK